jgi:uncharacterized membrane protein
MHSWHPVIVHVPLVGLVVAVAFDFLASRTRSTCWRKAASALWWLGLLGAVAAVTTGLIAYGRVEHSDLGHAEMVLHRNLALLAVTILLITAAWRWRRPYARGAALLGLVGAAVLGGVGYLGGDLVYRHGLGIPTETLEEIAHERGGHAHGHAAESTHPDSTAEHPHD